LLCRRLQRYRQIQLLRGCRPLGADHEDADVLVPRVRAPYAAPSLGRELIGDPVPTNIARCSVELCKQDREGIEQNLDRHADPKVARSIYRTSIEQYPGRLIMLCDGARVLIRSDRPDA
jgi:hypothetical protein